MVIEYEVLFDDLVEFNMYHSAHSQTVKRSLILQRFITPIIFLAIPVIFHYLAVLPLTYTLTYFGITAFLWILFYPRYFHWYIKKRLTKFLKEGENKGVLGHHTLSLSSEGLREKSEIGETSYKWNSVQKVVTSEHNILIYTSAIGAFIIPLRSFKNKEESEEFIERVLSLQHNRVVENNT